MNSLAVEDTHEKNSTKFLQMLSNCFESQWIQIRNTHEKKEEEDTCWQNRHKKTVVNIYNHAIGRSQCTYKEQMFRTTKCVKVPSLCLLLENLLHFVIKSMTIIL